MDRKQKNTARKLKTYFLIVNLIIATIAFSSLISAPTEQECVQKCIQLRKAGFLGGVGAGFQIGGMENLGN